MDEITQLRSKWRLTPVSDKKTRESIARRIKAIRLAKWEALKNEISKIA